MNRLPHAFRRLSLRWKVVAIMLGVTAVSLIVVSVGMLLHERAAFEQQTERKLTLLADVIGLNSTAALAFNDSVAATETLAALASDQHVMAAALYDTQGRLFARYLRGGINHPLPALAPPLAKLGFADGRAALTRAVEIKGQALGKVYVLADTLEWRDTLLGFLGLIGLLFVAVLTVVSFVSIGLQRLVTDPITDLVQLMARVARERDPTLRAVKHNDDELGVLVTGFNDMLDEIAKGRGELEHAHVELHRLNEELERRVLERTEQLELANKELESFSYSVSHDLRAPLRAIDGFSRVLLDEHSAALDSAGQDCLARVRRAAQRMGMLIDDLLKLAHVTRSDPNREEMNLSLLAQEVATTLQSQDPQRTVHFAITPELKVQGDARLLRIAMENLLGNAWKFTGARSDARIELGVQADTAPVYFMRDNGAGFDMTYAGKLFAPFQRLHTLEEFPGTGIGLATVHRIIRKHGGRIWAEGAVGHGATFYFTLAQEGGLYEGQGDSVGGRQSR